MRIAIGADHAGFGLKEELKRHLLNKKHDVLDVGNRRLDPRDDYPDFSHSVAYAIQHLSCQRGIIICTTGAGTCIVANKYPGIRAVECANVEDVRQAREHLDANVMTIGAIKVHKNVANDMADAFIETPARHGRHARRRAKMEERKV
jgi:RpiB/LacA/LacB family sugar-phosphate isomerase